jgi:hypothetical protein
MKPAILTVMQAEGVTVSAGSGGYAGQFCPAVRRLILAILAHGRVSAPHML